MLLVKDYWLDAAARLQTKSLAEQRRDVYTMI